VHEEAQLKEAVGFLLQNLEEARNRQACKDLKLLLVAGTDFK
jgi:hypothetical protein